jgi:hypothetical protein
MASGNLQVGRPITLAAAGQAVVIARSCQLLGFIVSATQTLALNDAATVASAAAGNQILAATVLPVGWTPFPVDLVNGLVANPGTGNVVFVVA